MLFIHGTGKHLNSKETKNSNFIVLMIILDCDFKSFKQSEWHSASIKIQQNIYSSKTRETINGHVKYPRNKIESLTQKKKKILNHFCILY